MILKVSGKEAGMEPELETNLLPGHFGQLQIKILAVVAELEGGK
jgi:hypothetical protein